MSATPQDKDPAQQAMAAEPLFDHPAEVVQPSTTNTGLVRLKIERRSACLFRVTVSGAVDEKVLVVDTVDLARSSGRQKIVRETLKHLALDDGDKSALTANIESVLLAESQKQALATEEPTSPQYVAVEDDDGELECGLYRKISESRFRLTNFTMRIEEDRVITSIEDDHVERVYRGNIHCQGQDHPFTLTAQEYVDNLETAVHLAAGPKIELLAHPGVIRNAIAATSKPSRKDVTSSIGWADDFSRFLVPGGWVDATGYHEHTQGANVPEVDLSNHERARWIAFRPLTPNELLAVKWHIACHLMWLHDPDVVAAGLGAVVLAPLMRFTRVPSRPLVWFRGLTGNGKSYLTRFLQNFFGDFASAGAERYISWTSTANYIQQAGFYFRDVLYLVDDYKREDVRHGDVVRVLQNYSDGAARSRLRADATANTTRPILGLLVSTGEDFPEANASGRARAIIIPVHQRPKDFAIAKACQDMQPYYKGFMASFLHWVIYHRLWEKHIPERVEYWKQSYYAAITGCANDARIAANHACLAASFELLADFQKDVWTEAPVFARNFCDVYLRARVLDAAGAVAQDIPAQIFLDTLNDLLGFDRVQIEVRGKMITRDAKSRVVGRLLDVLASAQKPGSPQVVVGLSIPLSLGAVQESLRSQGKQPLQASEKALLDQLADMGALVDKDNQPITAQHTGERTRKERLDGGSVWLARVPISFLPALGTPPASQSPGLRIMGG